jgi:hypothetical protein
MNSLLQTILALALVALAVAYLVWRWRARGRHDSGCCGPDRFKQALRKRDRS